MSALGDFFKEVADAIRSKKGTTDIIVPIDFPQEILSIETGATPTGDIEIKENGTYDVTNYANAVVNVPTSGGSGELVTGKRIDFYFPEGRYNIGYKWLNNGTIAYQFYPVYALSGQKTLSLENPIVGTDLYFASVNYTAPNVNVTVTGDLKILSYNKQGVMINITGTSGGTITITEV